jgi:hypothetical protein
MAGEAEIPAPGAGGTPTPAGGLESGQALPPGFRLGEYTLAQVLGHGSMATVYLARDATGHEVAIKAFHEGPGVSPTLLERFRREAEASKKLRKHPHIIKVFATGREGPWHYIVMDAIPASRTLEDVAGPEQPADLVTRLVVKIARALHFAHQNQVIHRDVKPSNIMIDEFGEPLLTDFGVASLIDLPALTLTGALTGTPLYMSPEQARGDTCGPEGDVYALGVVLFEALTGRMPYSVEPTAHVKSVLEAVKTESPQRPRSLRDDISPELEAVILKAIEKSPRLRYATAADFADDLERALAGRRVEAPLFSRTERLIRWLRHHDEAVAAVALVAIMAAGGAWYLYRGLLEARYERVLTLAQLRNFGARVARDGGQTAGEAGAPAVWNDIRSGRRAMAEDNWTEALVALRAAAEGSLYEGDARTAAIAHLEAARCQVMLDNGNEALRLYRSVVLSPDSPPTVAEQAQFEALLLHLLRDDRAGSLYILSLRSPPETGALADAFAVLAGRRTPAEAEAQLDEHPRRFRNDLLLAAAVADRRSGDPGGYRRLLDASLRASVPSTEWPSALARRLAEEEDE